MLLITAIALAKRTLYFHESQLFRHKSHNSPRVSSSLLELYQNWSTRRNFLFTKYEHFQPNIILPKKRILEVNFYDAS